MPWLVRHFRSQTQQRGLASTIRADETNDVALRNGQRAIVQRPFPPVAPSKTAGLDHGAHWCSTPARRRLGLIDCERRRQGAVGIYLREELFGFLLDGFD